MTPRTENGWGSVYNGGITGGLGGIELSFSDFPAMWIWMNENKETPAILTYTGADFSREGFPQITPNSTFSNSCRFQILGLKNKTIRASQGQKLSFCVIRFRTSSENIIWENWNHENTPDDLIDIFENCINIWVRHCRLNQNVFNTVNAPTDGNLDIGLACNYVAITDCIIENGDKTLLISWSNDEPNDEGKMKTTIRRCKFLNNRQRKPSVRYGTIGYEYNICDDRDMTVFNKVIGVGKLSRFFVYRSTFRGGSNTLFEDRQPLDGFPIEDAGALKSVENSITGYASGTTEIRPELVDFDPRTEPNYTLEDWTIEEAANYVDQWAGPTMHLMSETEFTLTVTAGDNGAVNTAGGDFEPSTSVFLQAFPASGFRLLRWERLTGDTWTQISTATSFNFLMPSQNTQVRALFTPISQGNKFFARKKQNI
jgi:pectate lyase